VAVDKLVALYEQQGVRVVIGPLLSAEAQSVISYANGHNILLISPSSAAVSLAIDDNLLRLAPTDAHQAHMLSLDMDRQEVKRVIPVTSGDIYGTYLVNAFSEEFSGETLEPITLTGTDYAGAVDAIRSAAGQIDDSLCVLIVLSDTQTRDLLLAAASDSQVKTIPHWYGAEAVALSPVILENPEVAAFASEKALRATSPGKTESFYYFYADTVLNMVREASGREPSRYVWQAWDVVWLIAETLKTASLSDMPAFKHAFISNAADYLGASVMTELDANGDRVSVDYGVYAVVEKEPGMRVWKEAGRYFIRPDGKEFFDEINPTVFSEAMSPITLTIGALLPLTGSLSEAGQAARSALELALRDFNADMARQGTGLSIALAYADTRTDPAFALSEMQRLHSQGITSFIGPIESQALQSAEDYIRDNGLCVISPKSSAPSMAKQDRIMRLVMTDDIQALALSALMEHDGIEAVVVVHRDDAYGNDLAQAFAESFPGTTALVGYDDASVDYQALADSVEEAMQQADADALLAIGYDELVEFIASLDSNSPLLDVRWYGTDLALNLLVCQDELLAARATSTKLTCTMLSPRSYSLVSPPLEYLRQELNIEGELLEDTPTSYDALFIFGLSFLNTGPSPETDSLWNALLDTVKSIRGYSGRLALDTNADQSIGAYALYRVQSDSSSSHCDWRLVGFYRGTPHAGDDPLILIP